ncbi:hypothetical protein AKN92_11305 [Thiopseudomonas alkaliphila]|nr:hypothetical protein AKN92_11305 [Thiopseudomonas alkaliphila]
MTHSSFSGLTGPLLRSGRSGDYSPLGEVGQPVFKMAQQLRESIKRKLSNISTLDNPQHPAPSLTYADFLAIPQADQLADTIDWYSSFPGPVIAWNAASDEEQDQARQHLRAFEAKLNHFIQETEQRLSQQPPSLSGSIDLQVFAKLLSKVLYTPSPDYVYLVNGYPVLTFWGFTLPNALLPTDPLLPLFPSQPKTVQPAAKPVSPPTSTLAREIMPPKTQPVIAPVPTIQKPWWRRWWWLLPLLLLLLALWLLFGLRYCSPNLAAQLGMPDLTRNWSTPALTASSIDLPRLNAPQLNAASPSSTAPNAVENNPLSEQPPVPALVPEPELPAPSTPDAEIAEPSAGEEAIAATQEPPLNAAEPPTEPVTENAPDFTPPTLDETNPAMAESPRLGEPLHIPTSAKNGPADFLNGKWKAGAGIQDKTTGKPLRLEYAFTNGQGQVTVQRADGARCTGNVNAEMSNGQLAINSQGQARCPDGNSFDMPSITCASGATSVADCTGSYGTARFPISMRNAQ